VTDDKSPGHTVVSLTVSLAGMSSVRRADPLGVLALAAAGAMTAHEIGYLGETGESAVSHEYFGVLGPIVILALCSAAWFGAIRILQRDTGRAPSLALLAGVQVGLFAAMEIGERLSTGSTSSLLSTPVVLGLTLQPFVAWAALRLLSASRRLIEAFLVPEAPEFSPAALQLPHWRVDVLVETVLGARLRVRGPPMA
jgi:hypothetical protein|tara:strand:+ start:3829 stop:4419 length:591 start_codon:yes stop_codon:yes gene_type:complete